MEDAVGGCGFGVTALSVVGYVQTWRGVIFGGGGFGARRCRKGAVMCRCPIWPCCNGALRLRPSEAPRDGSGRVGAGFGVQGCGLGRGRGGGLVGAYFVATASRCTNVNRVWVMATPEGAHSQQTKMNAVVQAADGVFAYWSF